MVKLCCVCARGGSKEVPGKNIKVFNGLPLIAHTIIQAKRTGVFDYVVVSSDNDEILSVADQYDVDLLIKRPDALATDGAGKLPVIQHCITETEKTFNTTVSIVADLDATAPLRSDQDVIGAIELLEEKQVSNVVSGTATHRSPYFNIVELNKDGYVEISKIPDVPIVSRQAAPKAYDLNGAVYAWDRNIFMQDPKILYGDTLLYEMPLERSTDINTQIDWDFVEFLLQRQKQDAA